MPSSRVEDYLLARQRHFDEHPDEVAVPGEMLEEWLRLDMDEREVLNDWLLTEMGFPRDRREPQEVPSQ